MRLIAIMGIAATLVLSGCAAETGGAEQPADLEDDLVTYPDVAFHR